MANSLKKQTQGDTMNLPPGIDRIELKNGTVRYRVRIRIKNKKPVSKNFKTLTHAKQWKRVTEGQIEKGLYVNFSKAEQYTLSDAILRYRKEVLPHKRKDQRNVARHLDRWEKELGYLKLSHLTASTIGEVRDRMLAEVVQKERKRSGSTVNRYLATLSHVLSTATRSWDWITENQCLKVKKPRESSGRLRYLSKEEISSLLDACQQSNNPHISLIFQIALTTGARKSEILGLRGKNLDFENGLIYLADTKNTENRSVPMGKKIFQLLQERNLQREQLVFPSGKDPSKPCCIRSAWEISVKKAGIQNFRFHDVRHTTASHLALDNVSIQSIAEILGHKSLQMSMRYSHLSHEHKRKLVNRMEKIINEESQ